MVCFWGMRITLRSPTSRRLLYCQDRDPTASRFLLEKPLTASPSLQTRNALNTEECGGIGPCVSSGLHPQLVMESEAVRQGRRMQHGEINLKHPGYESAQQGSGDEPQL
ncbi:unnamed protein product [Pleuronectes platessa]|uniref:Uncharacterized protein n=1 Tax=Pleuronectes platessa TaxID=8262 RepID=A0A9N7Z2L3_PLEPL|nr:unnamed protein product [Pleuronectes platessa]